MDRIIFMYALSAKILDEIIHSLTRQGVVSLPEGRFPTYSYRLANNVEITGTGLETKKIYHRLGIKYPNPFSGITTIPFHLSVPGDVSLRIFDMNGNEILILRDQYLPEGDHTVAWNAAYIQAGPYIFYLKREGQRLSRRMLVH